MSRLFYDVKPTVGNFKSGKDKRDEYFEKLAKLIPSEIIAGYLAMIGLVPLIKIIPKENFSYVYYAIFVIGLIATYVLINRLAEANKPKGLHIVVSCIAYVIWVYNVSGELVFPSIFDRAIGGIILIAFTLVSPKIPLS